MKWITMIAVGLALMLPSVASAAGCNSTSTQYSKKTCPVVSTTHSGTAPGGPSSASAGTASTLPFTGLDVGVLAAGGGILLGAGLVVRRLATSK